MLHRALEQFLSDVHWGPLDYLARRHAAGHGRRRLSLGQLMPRAEALVVTTPQPAAQRVAERAAAMVRKLGQSLSAWSRTCRLRLPLLRRADRALRRGRRAASPTELGVPLLGEIPLEPALREGADAGDPSDAPTPRAASAHAITALAERLDAPAHRPATPASPLAVSGGYAARPPTPRGWRRPRRRRYRGMAVDELQNLALMRAREQARAAARRRCATRWSRSSGRRGWRSAACWPTATC